MQEDSVRKILNKLYSKKDEYNLITGYHVEKEKVIIYKLKEIFGEELGEDHLTEAWVEYICDQLLIDQSYYARSLRNGRQKREAGK